MNLKLFGKAALKCCLVLLASILAGIVLMSCVYMLPTGRMLTQADRSLSIFENEGTSFCWAPEERSARLDGFTDAIMLQTAVYVQDENPMKAAMRNDRMEFSEGKLDPAGSLKQYVYGNRSGYVVSYARYWHGYLLFLKPLLLFFSLSDIRMMNAAFQLILGSGWRCPWALLCW